MSAVSELGPNIFVKKHLPANSRYERLHREAFNRDRFHGEDNFSVLSDVGHFIKRTFGRLFANHVEQPAQLPQPQEVPALLIEDHEVEI